MYEQSNNIPINLITHFQQKFEIRHFDLAQQYGKYKGYITVNTYN